jgi:hypothetical protein
MNPNSFTAPAFRVFTRSNRLVGNFEDMDEAINCAEAGKERHVYQHRRPSGGCEGNYQLMGIYGTDPNRSERVT